MLKQGLMSMTLTWPSSNYKPHLSKHASTHLNSSGHVQHRSQQDPRIKDAWKHFLVAFQAWNVRRFSLAPKR
eukprot:9927312-Karenia_brevis.AAC.1